MRIRMKKNYRVMKRLIELRFQRIMMFRLSFFGPFFVDGSLFLVQLLVFKTVYSNVDRIGTWGKGDVILFVGTFSLLNAVNMVICFFGVNGIPSKVMSGELDLYLTKPVSPLLRLSLENVNPGSVPLIAMSILIIIYGIQKGNVELTVGRVASYCFWVLVMQLLYYEMEVIIRSLSFFFVSVKNISKLEEVGLSLCMQLPGVVFRGIYKIIFCVIIPYGIMATMPVQSMIGEMTPKLAIQGVVTIVVFTLITAIMWKGGLKRYNSVSS